MDLVPRRIRMKVKISSPAGRRINLFWGPRPNPPLWGKENVTAHCLPPRQSQICLECMNDNIVILCSSWAENKRIVSCRAWRKLCHHLLLLPILQTWKLRPARLPKVHTWPIGQRRKDIHIYFPNFWSRLFPLLQLTKSHIIFKTKFRDASEISPPPPWAHCNGAESCYLFLDASCMLWGCPCAPVWPTLTSPQCSQLFQPCPRGLFLYPTPGTPFHFFPL